MAADKVRRAYRELADPERAAWARMMARQCQVAMKRKLKVLVIVGKEARGD